ncbi:MAG: TIGR02530 family flagellar biosynthesis protein [Rhodothermales bacterium]
MTVRELAARIDTGQTSRPSGAPPARHGELQRSSQFAEELRRAREQEAAGFKLSAHARERIEQRGISLNASEQRSLNEAIQQLEEKGSKDALLLRSDAAFVVNVPSRTVVTAVETNALRERVFTQIDSALML